MSTRDSFNFSWEDVSRGFWKRYPNPNAKHVLSEDTISRYITREGSLVTKRLLVKKGTLPSYAKMIVGEVASRTNIVEESIIDPISRTITTYTRNIGLTHIMQIEEKCVYRPDPVSPYMRTICERQAWVSSGLSRVSKIVTEFGLSRFKKSTQRATKGLIHVLEQLRLAGQNHSAPLGPLGTMTASQQAMHQATEKIKEKAKMARGMAKNQIPLCRSG